MSFDKLTKEARIAKGLTLRQCCAELGVDPSNWSKMERGIVPPPRDPATLASWAAFLGLDGVRRQEFFDLAALARNELPADLADDAVVMAALPVFFRAVRGSELEGAKLQEFITDLRSLHQP